MSTSNGPKMSDNYMNEFINEWVLMNLNDSSSESESSVAIETRSTSCASIGSLSKDIHCHYKCGICGDEVLDYSLPKHHYTEHADITFDFQMYEPTVIDQHVHCFLCNSDVPAIEFQEHQKECYTEPWMTLSDSEMDELSVATSELSSTYSTSDTPSVIISRIFRCEACGALVFEENLDSHHESIHSDIPLNFNIYELYEIAQQEYCEMCGEWVEKLDAHQRNCHADNLVEEIDSIEVDGCYYYVRISKAEFQKFGDRIVRENGQFVLRDIE